MFKILKFTIAILLVCVFGSMKGQNYTIPNLPHIDDRGVHFGFSVGLNSMTFDLLHSETYSKDGYMFLADVPELIPGFSVGIIGDMRLARYFNLRVTPMLHFSDRVLSYVKYLPSSPSLQIPMEKLNINSASVDVPLLLKYSAERYKNYRPYLIAGGGVIFDLTEKENAVMNLSALDYYWTIGVGTDIYFPYFKFAPELKFGFGTKDILSRNIGTNNPNPEYTLAIDRLRSRFVSLIFHIE